MSEAPASGVGPNGAPCVNRSPHWRHAQGFRKKPLGKRAALHLLWPFVHLMVEYPSGQRALTVNQFGSCRSLVRLQPPPPSNCAVQHEQKLPQKMRQLFVSQLDRYSKHVSLEMDRFESTVARSVALFDIRARSTAQSDGPSSRLLQFERSIARISRSHLGDESPQKRTNTLPRPGHRFVAPGPPEALLMHCPPARSPRRYWRA